MQKDRGRELNRVSPAVMVTVARLLCRNPTRPKGCLRLENRVLRGKVPAACFADEKPPVPGLSTPRQDRTPMTHPLTAERESCLVWTAPMGFW